MCALTYLLIKMKLLQVIAVFTFARVYTLLYLECFQILKWLILGQMIILAIVFPPVLTSLQFQELPAGGPSCACKTQ